MTRLAFLPIALMLGGCVQSQGYIAAETPVAGITIGIAAAGVVDVVALHGCFGVWLSNQMPWNWGNPYVCEAEKMK